MNLVRVWLSAAAALAAGACAALPAAPPRSEAVRALETEHLAPADRFLIIDGARVRVREEGPAGAPPVIMLHGFTYSLESWDAWAAALSADHRVIRYDLLGHGLTGPDPQERYAPHERAAFVGEVMDALDIDAAVIAGNSLGALMAWRFAAAHPRRVRALVLAAPAAYPYAGFGDAPLDLPDAMRAHFMDPTQEGVRASLQAIWSDDAKITPARLAVVRAMMRREGNGLAMVRHWQEFTLPDPTPELAAIAAPALLMWGADDVIVPVDQGERLAAAISGARLIVYEGVGHTPHEEAPERTAADARAFLAGLAPALGAARE